MGPKDINVIVPPELTDQIIDHLHDDTRALRQCSLTCRSWLPAARCHLFERVRIDCACRTYNEFLHLIRREPVVADSVHDFVIECREHYHSLPDPEQAELRDLSMPSCLQDTFDLISPLLKFVGRLTLTGLVLNNVTRSAITSRFSSIHTLRLSRCITRADDLFKLFAALPHLECFEHHANVISAAHDSEIPSLPIHTLRVISPHMIGIWNLVTLLALHAKVDTLIVTHVLRRTDFLFANNLMLPFRDTVTRFELTLDSIIQGEDQHPAFAMVYHDENILYSVHSERVQELELGFGCHNASSESMYMATLQKHLVDIATILLSDKFRGLKRLVVRTSTTGDEGTVLRPQREAIIYSSLFHLMQRRRSIMLIVVVEKIWRPRELNYDPL
ncbi:hypothetical protein A0H81_09250 [Grifola frondosa]|uniref:F-box domain-containing protein n=1 Tax=Grifola frondosa TaxID=5627 RepID=A0A1C7M0S2_GRIFR|nr:hypothetical protein A0H81_09250 [Grifola frondosa]